MKIPFFRANMGRASEALPALELQNLYPAMEGPDFQASARQGPALVQPAGAVEWTDRGSAPIRGLFQFDGAGGGLLYSVCGTALEKIAADKSATSIGTVSGTDPIIWDMIRDTVLLSANGKGYYTTGTTLTEITDPDVGTVGAIAAMDGRAIIARDASDTFVYSNVFAPGTVDSLAFATAEAYGDRLVRPMVYQHQLFLLGERSAEIWVPTGDSDNPFARLGGAVEAVGLTCKYSPAMIGPTLLFVANTKEEKTPFVAKMSPGIERVSDIGIEKKLRALSSSDLALVRGFAYRQNGAGFYQLEIPGAGTWCLHLESGTWFRRRKGTDTLWHSNVFADAYQKTLVGSSSADGKIYELDPTAYTDAGDTIRRIATCYLPAERPTPIETLFIDAMTTGATGTPTASVQISQDDGGNWRPARTINLDKAGARQPLSFAWGAIRRPGALMRATFDGAYGLTLYNALVNEAAT